jgi:hypothetical protein
MVIVEVAASVTPRRHNADSTVLDEHRQVGARGSAAGLGGDVVGTHQIPVPLEPTVRASEPAAPGLGDPRSTGWAGRGGATLIHQPDYDAGPLGLVAQRLQEVAAAPPAQAQVLDPANIPVSDSCGVAHH